MAELDKIQATDELVDKKQQDAKAVYDNAASAQSGNEEWLQQMQAKLNAVPSRKKEEAPASDNSAWLEQQNAKLRDITSEELNRGKVPAVTGTVKTDTTTPKDVPVQPQDAPAPSGNPNAFAGVTEEDFKSAIASAEASWKEESKKEAEALGEHYKKHYGASNAHRWRDEHGAYTQYTKGDTLYRDYDDGHKWVIDTSDGKWQYLRHTFPNGDIDEYHPGETTESEFMGEIQAAPTRHEAPHIPKVGFHGGKSNINHIISEALNIGGWDAVNFWQGMPLEERDGIEAALKENFNLDNSYIKEYAEMPEQALQNELDRQERRFRSATNDVDKYDASRRVAVAIRELQPKMLGFENLSDAKSDPGMYDMLRYNRKNLFGSNDVYDYYVNNNIPNSEVLKDYGPGIENRIEDAYYQLLFDRRGNIYLPIANYVNMVYGNEEDIKKYKKQVAARAGYTHIPMNDLMENDYEDWARRIEERVDAHIKKDLDDHIAWMKDEHPVLSYMWLGSRNSLWGKFWEAALYSADEVEQADKIEQNYGMGFWGELGKSGISLAMDLPIIIATSGGASYAVGGAEALTESFAARMAQQAITMSAISLLGQTATDLQHKQFSGADAYLTASVHGAVSGLMLGAGGELTSAITLAPKSLMRIAANKVIGNVIETAAFSIPQWVEAAYKGELAPEIGENGEVEQSSWGKMVRIAASNAFIVAGMKLPKAGKGWKTGIKDGDYAQLREAGYGELADAIKNDQFSYYDKETGQIKLFEGVEQQLGELMMDMGGNGKGISWDAFRRVMRQTGRDIIPPAYSKANMKKNAEGKYVITLTDSSGKVITEKVYEKGEKAKAEKDMQDLEKQSALAEEMKSITTYETKRESLIMNEALSRVAETLNEGRDGWMRDENGNYILDENGNRVEDPNYVGHTPETAAGILDRIIETPKEQRTPEDSQLLDMYRSQVRALGEGSKDADAMMKMICERYGVTEEEVGEVAKLSPKERKSKSPAAKAYAAYLETMRRGPVNTERPVGTIELNGETVEVFNTPDIGDKMDFFVTKDENGKVQMVSTKEAKGFTPYSNEREQNFERSRNKLQEQVTAFEDTLRDSYNGLSDEGLESEIKELEMMTAENADDALLMQLDVAKRVRQEREAAKAEVEAEAKDEPLPQEGEVPSEKADVPEEVTEEPTIETEPVIDNETPSVEETVETPTAEVATGKTDTAADDAMWRKKAEAFVEAYFGDKTPEEKAGLVDFYSQQRDFENTVSYDKQDNPNDARVAAYENAVKSMEAEQPAPAEDVAKPSQPTETPQPVNDMQPAKVETEPKPKVEETPVDNSQPKDRIDELLDAMGFEGDERAEQRAFYEDKNNAEQFEQDYKDFVGKEVSQPKEEVKAEEKKDEVVNGSQQEPESKEPEIVDDINTPMPTKTVKGKQKVDYSKTTPRRGYHNIYNERGLSTESADKIVKNSIKAAEDAIKAHAKKKPKEGTADDIDEWMEQNAAWEQENARLEVEKEYWEEVQNISNLTGDIKEIEDAKNFTSRRDVFNKMRNKYASDPAMRALSDVRGFVPQNLYDACVHYLTSGVRFVWDAEGTRRGLKQQTGWGDAERKKLIAMLSKDGITPEKAVHEIVDAYGADLGLDLSMSQDILNTLLDAINSTGSVGSAHDYVRTKLLEQMRNELTRRLEGETRDAYDTDADRYYDEQVQQYRNEHPELEGATDEEVMAAMERERNKGEEQNEPLSTEQPNGSIPNETGVNDDFFESGGEEVPFQKGETAKPEQPKTKQARNFTARTIKKLRKAGVKVKVATQAEAQRVRELAEKVGAQFQAVWHGSGNKFDEFDHAHMGEGEGAQAYGWGTYVTQVEGIAGSYAKSSAAKNAGVKFRGADTAAAIERMFPDQNPDSKPISREIINIIRDLKIGYSFDNAKDYAVKTRRDWLGRHQNALDEYKKGLEAKEKVIERIENMSDEEYANTNFWDEANIAAYDNNNKENAAFFAWKRAAAIRAGNHRGRELAKEELLTELRKNLRDEKTYTLKDYEVAVKDAKDAYDFVNGLTEEDFETPKGGRYLYEVEIPDNDGKNYLPYNRPVGDEMLVSIGKELEAQGWEKQERDTFEFDRYKKDGVTITLNPKATGADVYEELSHAFGSMMSDVDPSRVRRGAPSVASEFLNKCGIIGIEYPAQYRSGGRGDGSKNYVIFNEADAKIINRTEFLTTSDGTIYGWHDENGIHLTEEGFNPDTPLHEYTHGFMRMLKETDPKTYRRVVEGLKESEVWQEVLNDEAYKDIHNNETAVASEVASRLSGRENASRVNTEFDRENIISYANAVAVGARVKNALRTFWDNIAEWFGAKLDKAMPADRFARMTLRALENGVNPDAVAEGGGNGVAFSKGNGTYTFSEKRAQRGGRFYQDSNGNIDLVDIDQSVFDKMGVKKMPFRMTDGMAHHVFEQHGKELGLKDEADAVRYVTDIMTNFDHVRLGRDAGTYIFSIENGRETTGHRSITIVLPEGDGEYMGIRTSGRERLSSIQKMPLLWEKSAVPSATDAVSANVPSELPNIDGRTNGSASNQSNGSGRKDTPEFSVMQENGEPISNESTMILPLKVGDAANNGRDVPELQVAQGGGEDVTSARLVDDMNRDYAAEMRELMRRRLRGEDVTAELEQLRADRRAAEAARSAESAPATSTGGAGNGEPPIEPPTPPASATPEPSPELPPTGYERPMSPIEMAKAAAIKAVADTKASLEQRNAARRELTASLRNIHKAMRIQKEYDRATVENVVSLAKMMYDSGLIDPEHRRQMSKLFTEIKKGAGKTPRGIETVTNEIMDTMLASQDRQANNEIKTLLNTKADKVGANGAKMPGEVDARTGRILAGVKEHFGKGEGDMEQVLEKLRNENVDDLNMREKKEHEDALIGAEIANRYAQTVVTNRESIKDAKAELKRQKRRYKNGEIGVKEYTEMKHAIEQKIREDRMHLAENQWEMVKTLNEVVAGGKENKKGFFQQQQKHANDVRHYAYSDLKDVSTRTQQKKSFGDKVRNNAITQFLTSSLTTLDTMLREFGRKARYGKGYLFDHIGRGQIRCSEGEWKDNYRDQKELDAKANELFGNMRALGKGFEIPVKYKWYTLIDALKHLPKIEVTFKDGKEMQPHTLDQAQAAYIYAANKQTDGAVKLRAMGISEADVERIKSELDPRVVELTDWIQEKLFPSRYEEYNAVNERLFGVPMTNTENYFPLEIDKLSIAPKEEKGDNRAHNATVVTGAAKERVFNIRPLDIVNSNIITLVSEHLKEMNHWKNFAEWNRDVNTLLNDITFKAKVHNFKSLYGTGEELWNTFVDVCMVASGDYIPRGDTKLDKAIVNLAKMHAVSKVLGRTFTAMKQLASLLTPIVQSRPDFFIKNMANPMGTVKWCLENLPLFEKRWFGRRAGDVRLEDTEVDWKWTRDKYVKWAAKWGLTPNAAMDLLAASIGGRSVYETNYNRYLKMGYDTEKAHRLAVDEAEIIPNESQQSSEGMFVAPIQKDRSRMAITYTLYRTASFGFSRLATRAIKDIKHSFNFANYAKNAVYEYKKMRRDGLTPQQARETMKKMYVREAVSGMLNLAMYAFGAQFMWYAASHSPYLLASDNDEKRMDTIKNDAWHSLVAGYIEGLPGGNFVSDNLDKLIESVRGADTWDESMKAYKDKVKNTDSELLPFFSDLNRIRKGLMSEDYMVGVNDLFNLLVASGTGVDPTTLTDMGVAIVDACGGDVETSKEAVLMFYRLMNVPQSQLDDLFIEELGMNARSARNLTVEDMARRYAYYKRYKKAPLTWWLYNEQEKADVLKKYEKRFYQDLYEENDTPEELRALADRASTPEKRDEILDKYAASVVAEGADAAHAAFDNEKEYAIKAKIATKYVSAVAKEAKDNEDPSIIKAAMDNETNGYIKVKLESKYVEALEDEGPEALKNAFETETDVNLKEAILKKYVGLIDKPSEEEKKKEDIEKAMDAAHGSEEYKLSTEIVKRMSLEDNVAYKDFTTRNNSFKSNNNALVKELSELGAKCRFKTNGKNARELSITEGGWAPPVKDREKAAKCNKLYNEHPELFERVYRNRWRLHNIKRLANEAKEHPEKADANYEEIKKLIYEDANDN